MQSSTVFTPVSAVCHTHTRQNLPQFARIFCPPQAPLSAEEAARIILEGVADGRSRIMVGEDAIAIDWLVRLAPHFT